MSEEKSLRDIRLEKLAKLKELGADPFLQEKFVSTHSAGDLLAKFDSLAPDPEAEQSVKEAAAIRFAGRIIKRQDKGKAQFAHLSDGDDKVQIYVRLNDVGEEAFEIYGQMDVGDHLGVIGHLMRTRTGEVTISVHSLVPLSKCLQTIPYPKEKDGQVWYSLDDPQVRLRHRHLDLLTNPERRATLLNRAKAVTAVRQYFIESGFLEVETPLLQIEAGGAAATPFSTKYQAYDMEVQLRISLELYLKRILCGDVPKVYEIGRVFRNEGVSNRHNPEFTLLEWYEAFVNLEDTQKRVEEIFAFVAERVYGSTKLTLCDVEIDFAKEWDRVDLLEGIQKYSGISPEELQDQTTAVAAAKRVGLDLEGKANLGKIIEKLLEVFVEPHLIQPTFVVGYPLETSPLAKKDPSRPGFTRRSEGYILGKEVCNMFSEINDPIDQRERFEQQMREKAGGDAEAHGIDEEFLYALECGMPPAGGCGIGMDRLAMMLAGTEHIREVLMFPMMKPRQQGVVNVEDLAEESLG